MSKPKKSVHVYTHAFTMHVFWVGSQNVVWPILGKTSATRGRSLCNLTEGWTALHEITPTRTFILGMPKGKGPRRINLQVQTNLISHIGDGLKHMTVVKQVSNLPKMPVNMQKYKPRPLDSSSAVCLSGWTK